MSEQRMRPTTIAALIGATLFWGLSFVVTKITLESFDQFTLVFLRFVATSIFFAALFLIRGFPRLPKSAHWQLLLIALFEPVLYFLAETAGLERTTAAKAAIIIATVPGFVLLFSRLFLHEKTGVQRVIGALVSIAGVTVLVAGDPAIRLEGFSGAVGDLFIIGAVLAAVCYMLLTRIVGASVSAIEITGYQFFYGTVLFLPIYLFNAGNQSWTSVEPAGIAGLIYLILFASIGGFLCYNYALTKTEASRAAVYLNGIPIVATLAGWTILGERLTPVQGIGAVVVFAGIYMVTRKRRIAVEK